MTGAARIAIVVGCLALVAGCGSGNERRFQLVAFCQGPSTENPNGEPVQIEFRQDDEVVARAAGAVGTAFTVVVPRGPVQIYVDGVRKGSVNEGVATDRPYHSPEPDEISYLASEEGCPETAPPAAVR